MCHSVVVQVRTGRKRFAANWTRVWPLAAMYALVGVQRAGRGERFVALGASVRTFSCKQPRHGKNVIWIYRLIIIKAGIVVRNYYIGLAYFHGLRYFF